MRPTESVRTIRRLARSITESPSPSARTASMNLSDLLSAVHGDKEAAKRLAFNLPSGVPEMAEMDRAFTDNGCIPPEMVYLGKGRWAGRSSGVKVEVHAAPDGLVQKVLVSSRPVKTWREAVESVRYHAAMVDDGTPEDEEDIESARAAVGANAIQCDGCGGKVDLDSDYSCQNCGMGYVSCPGCDKPYPMSSNEDDHCPMCGYSSWAELDETVSKDYMEVLMDGVKKAAETRAAQDVDYDGFKVHIEIVDRDGRQVIQFAGGDDADEAVLEDWMASPEVMLSGGLDSFLWAKDNPDPMSPPKPWVEPEKARGGG